MSYSPWFRRLPPWLPSLFLVFSPLLGAEQETVRNLRFSSPITAMINARAWDETQQNWHSGAPDELFFDAVHRFLLVRFPGFAAEVHAAMSDGFEISSARLVLNWQRQEFQRVAGYAWRGNDLADHGPPIWHVQAWALQHPWYADAERGPTWNAWIKDAGWWSVGGALGAGDRFQPAFAPAALNERNQTAEIDIVAALRENRSAPDPGRRLRHFEECGLILSRAELSDYAYGDRGLSIGVARTWVHVPQLLVTMRRSKEPKPVSDLPPPTDFPALTEALQAAGGAGVPPSRIAENLPELAAAWRMRRRGDMPEWMWNRVQEVWNIAPYYGIDHGYEWFSHMIRTLDAGAAEHVASMLQEKVLHHPPGWFAGHQHLEYVLPFYLCPEMLPQVAHYHFRRSFDARWQRPLAPDKVFSHGKVMGMGTLNHMAQARPKALLGAEAYGMPWLVEDAHFGLSLLNRQMIYSDGFSQEMGDSYYRGITLAPLQAAAKYSADPLMRLKTSLMVEKLLFEDICTYHPGLRRRVSRISRRAGGLYQYLLGQDVPEAALHTLSRDGVLIHLDATGEPPEVHGMRVFDMHATPPVRVALMAPWGAAWESNAIDRKPLPFRTVFSTRVMGRVQEPIHSITYMGENYALASEEAYTSAAVPAFAAWRRKAEPVRHLEDFGIMLLRGRLNEEAPTWLDKTPFGILQHNNRLIWTVKTHERKFVAAGDGNLPPGVAGGLSSFKAQVALMAYGPEEERQVFVNSRPVLEFPAPARHGDVIAIREGVTYIGLIPLPATDMGRRQEVIIRSEHPFLLLDAYILDREKPVAANDDETWAKLQDATGGWIVEFGDDAEHGSFESFVSHLSNTRVKTEWEATQRLWHVTYESGEHRLEMGFRTDWERDMLWHRQLNPSSIFSYRRVNGDWPWLPPGLDLDNPLGQIGTTAVLEKGGAVLKTREGQIAFLRVEPVSGVTVGINPFIDPTPFELITPEGVYLRSEGSLGLARITVQPSAGLLQVDYALPSPHGHRGIERLQQEQPQRFQADTDVRSAREQSARALLVRGFSDAPRVRLNGVQLPGPFARISLDGETAWRIPIAD